MDNKRAIGAKKETMAIDYLTGQNVQILDRNYYFPGGELDIIGKDGEYLVFIEVKYRKNDCFGFAAEAVTAPKQKKIRLGAGKYLYAKHLPQDTACRFDVIAIQGETIEWIKNAF